MSPRLFILGFLVATGPLRAESAETSPAPSPNDFSEALERLADLGLPDMEGAQWTGAAPAEILRSSPLTGWNFRQAGIEPAGRVWRLPGEPVRYLHFGGVTAEAVENAVPAGDSSMLETDLDHLVGALDEIDPSDLSDSFASSGDDDVMGRLLVFAAQVHRAGHSDHASRLVSALFRSGGDRIAIIDKAVSRFAEARLGEITGRFFETLDWAAYHRDLEALVEKFPRGWDKRLAVALLLPRVADRAADKPAPDPEPPGTSLDAHVLAQIRGWTRPPEDKSDEDDRAAILARIAAEHGVDLSDVPVEYHAVLIQQYQDAMGGGNLGDVGLWLLDPPDPEASGDAVEQTKALGFDAIPALAALAEDETLTPRPNVAGSHSSYFYSHSRESDAQRARRLYRSMERPLSRGEIATRLLIPILPGFDGDSESSAPAVRDAALEFWRDHRDADPLELARVYLEDGDESQRRIAAEHLAASDDPEAWEIFERSVLDAPDILDTVSFIQPYLEQREEAARPFFESFATRLREALDGVDLETVSYGNRGTYQIANAGGVEGFLGPLAVVVGASSIDDLLDRAIQAGADDSAAWDDLAKALPSAPLTELLEAFGRPLADAGATTRTRLLEALLPRAAQWTIDDRNEPPPADAFPAELATFWKPPLGDDSALAEPNPGSHHWFPHYRAHTVASAAALVLEFACNPEANRQVEEALVVFGGSSGLSELTRARAAARLEAREELPPFPSHENLSDDRKREIGALVENATPAQLREEVLALTPDERHYWIEWRSQFQGQPDDAPDLLLRLRQTVTHLPAGREDGKDDAELGFLDRLAGAVRERAHGDSRSDLELLASLDIAPGFQIDAPALESLARRLLREAGTHSGLVLQFSPAPLYLGLEAAARRGGENRDAWLGFFAAREELAGSEADAFALLAIDGGNNVLLWSLNDGEVAELTERVDGELPAFSALETFLESRNIHLPGFTIAILTREDIPNHHPQNQ